MGFDKRLAKGTWGRRRLYRPTGVPMVTSTMRELLRPESTGLGALQPASLKRNASRFRKQPAPLPEVDLDLPERSTNIESGNDEMKYMHIDAWNVGCHEPWQIYSHSSFRHDHQVNLLTLT